MAPIPSNDFFATIFPDDGILPQFCKNETGPFETGNKIKKLEWGVRIYSEKPVIVLITLSHLIKTNFIYYNDSYDWFKIQY